MIKIEMKRVAGEFGFEAKDQNGIIIKTDNSLDGGGNNNGFRPMQLLLAALGSCSAIDVISILKKQRQTLCEFNIVIQGEREDKEIPSLWKSIEMQFILSGEVQIDKALKACSLSVEKYCSVAETLRRAGAVISWTLVVNGVASHPTLQSA